MVPSILRALISIAVCCCVAAVALTVLETDSDLTSSNSPGSSAGSAATIDHDWPPVVGERYPDMALHDLEGRPVRLSSYAGKVLLICPIGTTSPGSIGFEGGPGCKPLAGFAPQRNLQSLRQLLGQHGVPIEHDDLITVHLLLYSTMQDPPTQEQAREWTKHFGLDRRENAVVLVGDRRYIRGETLRMIPGFQLVDRDFILRADGGGVRAPDNIYDKVIPMAARELGVEDPNVEATLADLSPEFLPATVPGHPDAARLFALLTAMDYAGLESECARLRANGRVKGSYLDQLSVAYEMLLAFPEVHAYLDAWCAAAPDSAYAHLVRGERLIDFAWEARGSGYADTVSEEGWRLFAARLSLAKAELEIAARLDPKLPLVPAAMITLGMGRNDSLREIFEHFKAAARIDPTCMKAYLRMLTPLLPRWLGDEKILFRFVRQAIESAPKDPAMRLLLVNAHERLHTGDARRDHLSSPKVRAELERAFSILEEAFPNSAGIWSRRSYLAWYRKDNEEAQRCRVRAVEEGSCVQMHELARFYKTGAPGIEKDPEKALELFCRAARGGDLPSCYAAGRMFRDGVGTQRNPEAAVAWFAAGAKGGDTRAMLRLGDLHRTGRGTVKNLQVALEWFRKSAAGGNKIAREYLPKFLAAHPELPR